MLYWLIVSLIISAVLLTATTIAGLLDRTNTRVTKFVVGGILTVMILTDLVSAMFIWGVR